jgi:hypothetical protein
VKEEGKTSFLPCLPVPASAPSAMALLCVLCRRHHVCDMQLLSSLALVYCCSGFKVSHTLIKIALVLYQTPPHSFCDMKKFQPPGKGALTCLFPP